MRHQSRLAQAVAATAGTAAVLAGGAPGAVADTDQPYSIQSLTGAAVAVGSGSCRAVPITTTYVNPGDSSFTFHAVVDVAHNGSPLDSVIVDDTGGGSADPTISVTTGYSYCPDMGLGRFDMGPSAVIGTDSQGTTTSFEDLTPGHFTVKRRSKTTLTLSRSLSAPRHLRLTSTPTAYSLRRQRYVPWVYKYVHFQRWDGRRWSDVRVVRLNRHGVARLDLYAPHIRRWRAVKLDAPKTWGSASHVHTSPPVPSPPPPPPPPAGPPDSAIRISRVQYDSPGSDHGSNHSLNAEWVRITNHASRAKKLTGWRLSDRSSHFYYFPTFKLRGGHSVTVHTGRGVNTRADLHQRRDWYVWNNTGDRATLRNTHGRVVDRCSWGDGSGATAC